MNKHIHEHQLTNQPTNNNEENKLKSEHELMEKKIIKNIFRFIKKKFFC